MTWAGVGSVAEVGNLEIRDGVRYLLNDRLESGPFTLKTVAMGGSLTASTYSVKVTALSEFGESLSTFTASIAAVLGDSITVNISRVPKSRGYRVYMKNALDTNYSLQKEVGPSQNEVIATITEYAVGTEYPLSDSGTMYIPIGNYDRAIAQALAHYNRNYYRQATLSVAMVTGTKSYDMPTDWVDGYSSILAVQYPVSEVPPEYIYPERDYYVKDGKWAFYETSPTTGQSAKMYYALPYRCDSVSSDIPIKHFHPFCMLAASYAADMIATRFAYFENRSVSAEVVSYETRPSTFKAISQEYRAQAFKEFGWGADGVAAACRFATWDMYANHSEITLER